MLRCQFRGGFLRLIRALLLAGVLQAPFQGQMMFGQTLSGNLLCVLEDQTGASLPGATIMLESASLHYVMSVTTAADGTARFARLAPADDYRVVATSTSFGTVEREMLRVHSGETLTVSLTLKLAAHSETLVVNATAPVISDSSEISNTVEARQLHSLPANGRSLNRFSLLNSQVRNTAGLGGDGSNQTRLSFNGAIFRDTQYRLDGNTNYDTLFNNAPLQRLSLSAVQEFRVLTNQFNAEHGSTSTGLILATTRSGTDTWHGESIFFARPSGLQAKPPLANMRIPNQLLQSGASLGGPIRKGIAHIFANYENTRQDRGSFISSPAPDFFIGSFRDHVALVRLDARAGEHHAVSLRVNAQRETNTNPNDRVGGLFQPSYASVASGQSLGTQLNHTATGVRFVNELRAGYINAVPSSTRPITPSTAIVRAGYSTEGNSTFSNVRTEIYQLADQVSIHSGRHTIKAGGDFIRRKVRDFSYDLAGVYTFGAGAPQPDEQPIQYSQRFGVARLSYGQTQWAGFVQDTWRIHSRLTLNLGLRYDYQSLLDDYNNLGPRFGFAWKLTDTTVVRGGGGLFYDQPFFHGLTQRFLLNGLQVPFAPYSIAAGDPAFPAFPNSFDPSATPTNLRLAPRNIVLRSDELRSPYTSQFTLGIQQQLGGWLFSVDAIRSLSVKQLLHFDRNAPTPFFRAVHGLSRSVAEADRTRPLYDPAAGISLYAGVPVRQVRETVNGGLARYHGLNVNLSRSFARRYQAGLSYTLSSALNSVTDDHLGANPNEWSDVVAGELAMSDFAQRHRFVAHGSVDMPWTIRLSSIATVASGLPVNALTGLDNNGDGNVVDRPAGFGRNAFRGSPQRLFDFTLAKTIRLTEAANIELRGDVFNAFNASNFHRFNNVYGNGSQPAATFLRPLGGIANADPGRQWTFGLKLAF